jgi:hypothetical protein
MTSMLKTRSPIPSVPLLLLAGAVTLGGCPFLDDFPRVTGSGRDDDGTDDDDADDDDFGPGDQAPEVIITGIIPMTIPVSGPITIGYEVSDRDSEGYLLVSYWLDSTGAERPTTLVGGLGVDSNEFAEVVPGAPPFTNHPGELNWDSVRDIPTTAGGITLKLCVFDTEGNVGKCDTYPETGGISVQNTLESGLGAFCQVGHLEQMNWLGGRAVVPLSDGSCLNYQKSDPALEDDFAAQFLLVMINNTSSEMGFTISATDQPTILGAAPPIGEAFGERSTGAESDETDVGFRDAPAALLDVQDGLAMADLTDELRRAALQHMDLGTRGPAPARRDLCGR